jgi:DNA-binding transcriptional MerR regulator
MKVTWTQEEVCAQTGLEPHILRFWEGEFPQLRPKRNSAGQRVYRERDIEIVTRLKGWIYDDGLAIPAARRRLKEEFDVLQAPEDPEQLGMPFLEAVAATPATLPSQPEVPRAVPAQPKPIEPAPAREPAPSLGLELPLAPTPQPVAIVPAAIPSPSVSVREGLMDVLRLLEN